MSKKCMPLWRKAHFEVHMLKAPHARTTLGRSNVVLRGRRKGLCTVSKMSKTWGICGMSKNDGRRGTFEEDLQRSIVRRGRNTRDMFIRAVRRSGRWFPERGCVLEHQIFRFAEIILRDRCSTSYDLASLFRGRRSSLDRWSGKIAKTHWYETVSSALNFPFLKDVSQNCFVFDVVNFKKMRKSRRIASFLTLSSSKIKEVSLNCCVLMLPSSTTEEVSQNSFVLKLADRQIDRETTTAATTTTSTTALRYYYNYKHTTLHYTTIITLRYANYIYIIRLHYANYTTTTTTTTTATTTTATTTTTSTSTTTTSTTSTTSTTTTTSYYCNYHYHYHYHHHSYNYNYSSNQIALRYSYACNYKYNYTTLHNTTLH